MKLSASVLLGLALVLTGSLAAALPSAPPVAAAGLQLATPASSCGASVPAFLPAPIASDVTIPCGPCSAAFCKGHVVGQFCGPTTIGRCVVGPSCSSGEVTCLCQ